MSKPDSYYRYVPVSGRDLQWGLCVTGAGYRNVPPGGEYPPKNHVHPPEHQWRRGHGRTFHEYGVVYVYEGRGEFESAPTGRVDYTAGSALLLFPDVWHRYQPVEETRHREHWGTFQGDHAARLQEHGFISPAKAVIETGVDDAIIHRFSEVVDRLRSETAGFQHVVAAATLEIVASILAAGQHRQTDSGKYELVRRCKAAIEEQTEAMPVIEELAEALDVSAGHLRRVFKEHTGLSPYQYHLQLKVGRAKTMLRESDMAIKQIARALGLENVYHFSKLFKSKTGMTPGQWRRGGVATSASKPQAKRRRAKSSSPPPRQNCKTD